MKLKINLPVKSLISSTADCDSLGVTCDGVYGVSLPMSLENEAEVGVESEIFATS